MADIKKIIADSETVLIGAGAGLSTSAGFTYTGERFEKYFGDFAKKYGFSDMYSGGFADFESEEEFWAYWSRYIFINRYMDSPRPLYEKLFNLVCKKNYFVLTTNVDHCFQKAGFDRSRLFYTQGDYGLFQCSTPCHQKTYDNYDSVLKMVLAQGFEILPYGNLTLPKDKKVKMEIPTDLIPHCPVCNKMMSMNLRSDGTFVEDEHWHKAAGRYQDFLDANRDKKIVYLELGVGANTPGIIKYPFWHFTYENPKALYICINKGEAVVPEGIKKQSICINSDIYEAIT